MRGAHPTDELKLRAMHLDAAVGDAESPVLSLPHRQAEAAQQVQHRLHVGDARHIVQNRLAVHQHGRCQRR